MYITLPVLPNSHDLLVLHKEVERLRNDTAGSKIKYIIKKKKYFYKNLLRMVMVG